MRRTLSNRILAVDPGALWLGAAVLEGEELFWYGVMDFSDCETYIGLRTKVLAHLSELAGRFPPQILAVEEPFYPQAVMSPVLPKLTNSIKDWARWRKCRVMSYTPPEVKAFFCRDGQTKSSLAEAMIARYPYLARYGNVSPLRQRYWFHVFDAVGLGLMCARRLAA